MISYTALIAHPNMFLRLTGHTKEEFIYMRDKFDIADKQNIVGIVYKI